MGETYASLQEICAAYNISRRTLVRLADKGAAWHHRAPNGQRVVHAVAFAEWFHGKPLTAKGKAQARALTVPASGSDEFRQRLVDLQAKVKAADRGERDEGYVYFIKSGGRVKIGWASDPERRMAELAVGNPRNMQTLGVLAGTQGDERDLHHRFTAFRVRGEWFELAPEIKKFIKEACRG